MVLEELQERTLKRVGEVSDAGTYYTAEQVRVVLDEAQRIFAFLTLCLEASAPLALTANVGWYKPLDSIPDWIVPLRVRMAGSGGAKLEAKRLDELDALSSSWQTETGTPSRYAIAGPNLLAVHRIPPAGGSSLQVQYARSPIPLAAGQSPEIPEQNHITLVRFAVPRLRSIEGGEEWKKALPDLEEFWQDTKKLAMYMRTRNLGSRYDSLPPEQVFFDRSRLFDLMRRKKWQTTLDTPQEQARRSPQTT
jgi:hypothetical protein